jgi:hypothetical protein
MEMARVLEKNPENKICSQMHEVFDLNKAYVVWDINIELNKFHITKANMLKANLKSMKFRPNLLIKNPKHAVFYERYLFFLVFKIPWNFSKIPQKGILPSFFFTFSIN